MVPWVRAVLHSFLAIFAPFEAIIHDIHFSAGFDSISWLSQSLGTPSFPWPISVETIPLYQYQFEHILSCMDTWKNW